MAAAAAYVGHAAVARTFGDSLHSTNLEHAHRLAPGDARISAQLSGERLIADTSSRGRTTAETLARTALIEDPTAVAAVATLGLSAQLRGDTRSARRLFAYSQTLSRRDLRTQLWAIEDSVARGDIADALKHYDIALRTSRSSAGLLFPVLASAIRDPQIRTNLIRTLAGKPDWTAGFISHAATSGADPRATALLFEGMRRVGVDVPMPVRVSLVYTLIDNGFVESAWSYYAVNHAGSDRRRSRDPRFAVSGTDASPFDWIVVSNDGVSTSIQHGPRGGVFDFSVSPGGGGPVLQQFQMLPSGRYRLVGHSLDITQADDSRPYWSLACRDGRELGQVVVPNSVQSAGVFAGTFTVPAGCPVQTLTLIARPSDSPSGVTGQIDRLQLEPMT